MAARRFAAGPRPGTGATEAATWNPASPTLVTEEGMQPISNG